MFSSAFASRFLALCSSTVALLALSACLNTGNNQTQEGCEIDGDCPVAFRCEQETGFCLCAEDSACDASEFCNSFGSCQPKSGCVSNDDCTAPDRPNDMCDTVSGQCVTRDASSLQCTINSHCPFGTVCANNLCLAGCADGGDCALGQPCINNLCDDRPGACTDNSYCEYGQLCNLTTQTCEDHEERDTLCQFCDPGPLACNGAPCLIDTSVPALPCTNDSTCSDYPNATCQRAPCLEDTDCSAGDTCVGGGIFLPGECSSGRCGRNFCGSLDCDNETDPCPRGYNCFELTIVSGDPCTVGDNTCQGGRGCSAGGENQVTGYCSCLNNDDCNAQNPLGNLECINPGPNGYCRQGRTCGPSSGLRCSNLR